MQFLFLVKDRGKSDFEFSNWNNKKRFFEQAKGKAEIVITSWNNLQMLKDGVGVKRGVLWSEDGEEKQIKKSMIVLPDYVHEHVILETVPRFKVDQNNYEIFCALMEKKIIENNEIGLKNLTRKYMDFLRGEYWPESKVSWNRNIIYLGKWYLEKCFLNAENTGVIVSRPRTFLKMKKDVEGLIPELLEKEDIIITKPHSATRLNGIHILTKENHKEKLEKIKKEPYEFLIIQKFIKDSFLYEGRKADLRIYVGVFNWNPLRFTVYRKGLTRISNRVFDMGEIGDEENSITTFSLLKTGKMLHNVTIDEYFATIPEDKNLIWSKIEAQAGKALEAIVSTVEYVNRASLSAAVYLLGFDFLLEKELDGSVKSVILEINHFPTLYRSATYDRENKVNKGLDKIYQDFFEGVMSEIYDQDK